jgi:thiosulfate reductase cytochrome b subunit
MPDDVIEITRRRLIHRHPLIIRVTHWINAACLLILLMSGLQIFNAHPALYFGAKSDFEAPALEMKAVTAEVLASGNAGRSSQSLVGAQSGSAGSAHKAGKNEDDGERSGGSAAIDTGIVALWGRPFDTTGWFGFTYGADGQLAPRGFPSWMTLPGGRGLATARRWHFTFAWLLVVNGLIYLAYSFATGHLRHDLWARAAEWRDIPHSIWEHVRLRFPKGDAARHYNVLQKLTYLAVIFIVLPAIVLTGMTMSPGLDARFPFLATMFGGRQTARTIHFILAFGLVAFVFVHVALVILSGFANNMRAMITGRYAITAKERTIDAKRTPSP